MVPALVTAQVLDQQLGWSSFRCVINAKDSCVDHRLISVARDCLIMLLQLLGVMSCGIQRLRPFGISQQNDAYCIISPTPSNKTRCVKVVDCRYAIGAESVDLVINICHELLRVLVAA